MNRFIGSGNLSDVYDGAIWKEHMSLTNPQTPNTLGLMLNIDWFKPFKHLTYSVGVIVTIMNLPHFCRHKQENVLTLGIIPGPSEPKHDLNSFLNPIVTELLELEQGAIMTHSSGKNIVEQINIRCLLLAVACDLPAVRKTCGFLSHAAKLGCSKCLKEFPGKPGEMNYFGFNRSTWLLRSNAQHRRDVNKIRHASTQKIRNSMESDFGCRYSELLRLSYFDPVKMHVIDLMHGLFLGTAKKMLEIWQSLEILKKSHFQSIQEIVDAMKVPSDVGRIPRKISSGFSGFTADQFKNWALIYSIPALFNFLSKEHIECWRHFVLACRKLCKHEIHKDEITVSDLLL